MRIRKLAISAVRSLLSIILFSLILTATTDISQQDAIGSLFGQIYDFADGKSKQEMLASFGVICENVLDDKTEQIVQFKELCQDDDARAKVLENCDKYNTMLQTGQIEPDLNLEEICRPDFFRTLEENCKILEQEPDLEMKGIGNSCEQHKNKIISDKEFFQQIINNLPDLPQLKVHPSSSALLFLSIIAVVLILILLVLHQADANGFFFTIGRILFNLGILFAITFIFLYAYTQTASIDTSPILNAMLNPDAGNAIEQAVPSVVAVVPFIMWEFFSTIHFIVAGLLIIIGLAIKIIFGHRIKKEKEMRRE